MLKQNINIENIIQEFENIKFNEEIIIAILEKDDKYYIEIVNKSYLLYLLNNNYKLIKAFIDIPKNFELTEFKQILQNLLAFNSIKKNYVYYH